MAGRKSAKRSGDAEEAQGLPGLEPPPDVSVEEAHHKGHRQRLYTRFLDGGPDALQDYELLEMILFGVNPRRDVKPLAKALIRDFGDLWSVVNAPPPRLRGYCVGEVSLASDKAVAMLRAVGAAALRGMRQRVMDRPVLANWQSLLDYCTAAMAHQPTEQFRLLFLDRKNKLIADEVQQTGTVDHTPVYPREVVRRALELSASAIILVHNHPSGDPTPSRADVEMTKEILRAAHSLGIAVHDHIIVGKGKHVSFKAQGLL
ncbi:RadC family protein [Azospirillum argentinense]|uniref:JAB domain-containing protein n=1 Tax=Azospirillum brasilense TaxID=192 RepID=A0A4D8PZ01_AZOBR|nr:DNA repair protein RadC [Azospirillum argentinense]QCO00736.1 JAB domain-containing protein [Azospirillum argentinense]